MLRPRSERQSVSSVPPDAPDSSTEETENLEPESGEVVAAVGRDRITRPEGNLLELAAEQEAARVTAKTEQVAPPPPAPVKDPSKEETIRLGKLRAPTEEPKPIAKADRSNEETLKLGKMRAIDATPAPAPALPLFEAAPSVETPAPAAVETPAPGMVETPAPGGVEASPEKKKKKKKKDKGEKTEKAEKVARADKAEKAPKVQVAPAEAAFLETPPPPPVTEKSPSEPVDELGETATFAEAAKVPVFLTAHGKHVDDDVDLSISHKFFTDGDSLVPPPIDIHDHEPEEKIAPPSKEAIAHRARLKRIVGGVVAVCSVMVLVGIGKMVFGSKSADAMPSNDTVAAAPAPEKKAEQPKEDTTKAAAIPVQPTAEAKPADSVAAADSAKPADSAATEEPKKDDKPALSEAEIKDLKMKAAIAAEGGGQRGIDAAKAAIDAEPTDGMMYMYLYNSYLSLGKGKDAQAALDDCVHSATKQTKVQCQAWGGKDRDAEKK